MNDKTDETRLLISCAERIKSSILSNFTYDDIENETGISSRTLKRLASGERDPKLSEIRQIAKATGKNPIWLAFGDLNTPLGEHAYILSSDKVGVNLPENATLEDAEVKMRVLTAVADMQKEDVVFIEKFVDLLNLDRTINKVKTKRYNLTEEETMKMLNLPVGKK
ncbi:helix-turn-helix transcriptional regulator [Salmonella enterica]|uniref:Helix-turn-helix transcriptional regulator n=2 Tax=Salmonella enterica TaxID=28901 RepID=A0A5Y6EMC6_SALER|nr:helix-turn-helix transcriptional regulator [Salmonella enterica]EAA7364339.1 XRE family transcriptional regulator [Salmonella enterica subsp. enterica]ECM5338277.1 helix-turn-helix transcriptional regulator [Salmonella enterica subsp. enterica serovar Give]EDB9083015.1 helix-turn-helix transcriptional regulator [Salmonella enterica subsp. enterica serovar Newport]EAO5073293.1 helix-turn-helix transcriptional regulator [Salmonella enterica]EAQ7627416.1 XRE family transcriptional regulator [S